MIYLIGSLRNPEVPKIANRLRSEGLEVFDDWYAAGPEADDKWRDYEITRGRSYREALEGFAAKNVYNFDRQHLTSADTVVLVLPAGKSGHLELGWALGGGKRGYILLDSPDRWDVMYQFATAVFEEVDALVKQLKANDYMESKDHSGSLSPKDSCKNCGIYIGTYEDTYENMCYWCFLKRPDDANSMYFKGHKIEFDKDPRGKQCQNCMLFEAEAKGSDCCLTFNGLHDYQ